MGADSQCRSQRRQDLLTSFRKTRTVFARAGDFMRASRIELGIQLLLDQRVSDRMLELLGQSAEIAARDAADMTDPRPAA